MNAANPDAAALLFETNSLTPLGVAAAVFIADKMVPGTVKSALELYMKACERGMGIACRQGAALLVRNDPESKALAASLDTRRLVADLLKRGCALGDQPSCAAKP